MTDLRGTESSAPPALRGHGPSSGAPVQSLPGRAGGVAPEAHSGAGRAAAPGVSGTRGVFVPLLLLTLAVLAWALFQMAALGSAHRDLVQALHAQHPQVVQARRLSHALSVLAGDTQRLADAGDPGARLIVAQLKQRGITIHPAAGLDGPLP